MDPSTSQPVMSAAQVRFQPHPSAYDDSGLTDPEGAVMSVATQPSSTARPITREPLVLAVAALILTDLVGGLLAVSADVNTWGEAWGSKALLAAPLPMIGAQ